MLSILESNETEIFEDIIEIIKENSDNFEMSDRKLFERKETTDNLKEVIGSIIEKYNSGSSTIRKEKNQISLFD